MVVSERILVNTSFFFVLSTSSKSQELSKNIAIDMRINTPRDQSISSSTNSSRATSVHSNFLSTGYAKHIQAFAISLTWADQVKTSISKGLALFYVSLKIEESNKTNKTKELEIVLEPHSTITDNMYNSERLESSAIPYLIN